MNLVKIETAELQQLEKSKAEQIKSTFEPMAVMLAEFEALYDAVIAEAQTNMSIDTTTKAKRLRLDIAKVRIQADKARKEIKAEYLLAGRAIDGVANILKWAVGDKESALESIEKHYEILEERRLAAVQDARMRIMLEFDRNADTRDYTKFSEDEFESLIQIKRQNRDAEIAAVKLAEEKRIAAERAAAEEREQVRLENERLRKRAQVEALAREAEKQKARELAEKHAAEVAELNRQKEAMLAEQRKREAEVAEYKRKQERQKLAEEQKRKEAETRAAEIELQNQKLQKQFDDFTKSDQYLNIKTIATDYAIFCKENDGDWSSTSVRSGFLKWYKENHAPKGLRK